MLVLSRRVGEVIYIGNDVTVTVVSIDRGKIRLGIKAPGHVEVWREEIYEAHQSALRNEGGTDDDRQSDAPGGGT